MKRKARKNLENFDFRVEIWFILILMSTNASNSKEIWFILILASTNASNSKEIWFLG